MAKITKIVQAKRKQDWVNVYLDEDFALSLPKSALIEAGIYKGAEVSKEELAALKLKSDDNKLAEKLDGFLAIRPRSEKEISDYLIFKREQTPEAAAATIESYKNKGLIDDSAFASWYVENRTQFGLHGSQKIRAELIKKGISRDIIESVLPKELTTQQSERLEREVAKLLVKYGALPEFERKRKIQQRLLARGFNFSEIAETLKIPV